MLTLFCGDILRNSCLHIRRTRNFSLCKQVFSPVKKTRLVHSPVNSQRSSARWRVNSNARLVLCVNSRTMCFLTGPAPTQGGRYFHTSAPKRALPAPLIWMVLKPLQKLIAILLGRSIRKWWVSLPHSRRLLLREWAQGHCWHLAAGGVVTLLIVALLLLTHLEESPVTGRVRLLVFSREKYLELAALTSEAHMEEFAEHLLPVTHPLHQLVERSVDLLVQKNKDILEVSRVPWSVHVVESPQINAFVLPNGKVFMFTGMLGSIEDVDQLMIVLGHEMAHAILEHSAEQASLSHVVDLLSLILVTAIWALCPGDSMALLGGWAKDKLTELLFSHPYSRKLEAEADQVGLQLAAKACADVRAGPVFWQQMELTDRLTGEPTLPEWLSTHPTHRNRSSQMDRLIPQALELRESCACPALPLVDPRAVFAETAARVLLQKAKEHEEGGPKGADHLQPASVPTGPPTLQNVLLSSSGVEQLNKGWAVASKTAEESPATTAAREKSQDVLQNNGQQGG